MATSVSSRTVTVSLSVLFSGTGSPVGPETSARLVTVPGPAEGSTSSRTVIGVASAPAVSVAPLVQVTSPASSLHDQPDPVAVTYVVPAGTASVTTMGPSVLEGPLFVTCRVQSKVCPATAVPVWVLVIARSTTASTSVTSVSTLLARLGSFVGDDTRAVFVRGAPVRSRSGSMSTTTCSTARSPAARGPDRSQVRSWPAAEHDHEPSTSVEET